jgi:pilus assembly protein FimV
MPSKKQIPRSSSSAFNLKTVSAAVVSALLFSNAGAAGLGKLTVLSSLGQPLRAEIELTTVAKEEAGALAARLGSPDAFRQAGIDFNSALTSLRFAVEQRGDKQIVRVTSAQPLNEPFVDMLLELTGPNGRLVREYTFLLDPADLRTAQAPQVAPAPVPGQAGRNAQQGQQGQNDAGAASWAASPRPAEMARVTRPGSSATPASPVGPGAPAAQAPRPPVSASATPDASGGEYRVRPGDSLAKIAGQYKSPGISLDQMLVAMFRNNPDAFANNNMNRLKAGQIINVPSTETARTIDATEARNVVVAQSADFNNYRNKLAGQVASAAPQKSADARQSAGGKITATVEEKATPANESKDKLKLSNTTTGQGDKTAMAGAEDKIAKEKAVAEASARVKELEKNVTDLQKLMEVKNKNLAEQQNMAAAKPEQKAQQKNEPATAAVVAAAPAAGAAASTPAASTPAANNPAASNPAASAPAASSPAPGAALKADKPAESATTKPAVKPADPVSSPSMVDELLANPFLIPGLGALLVALGGLGIYSARRKKQSKGFDDSIITDSSLKANSLFGSTGGQSVDTNNSVFNSSFSPSSSQLDTNEVDPVAEADVYIAYGRDAQAEEILKEALRTQPDRHAVRVKLLEIYSNRKDLRAFEVLATELYGMTKGEGPEWAQAVAMGVAIDPNNPLYAGGKDKIPQPVGTLVEPTQPLDEQGLATLLSATQLDTSPGNLGSLETDTSYFNNTSLDTDAPASDKKADSSSTPAAPSTPAAFATAPAAENTPFAADLDFDLDGMDGLNPPTKPAATPELPATPDLSSIDFNFLDEPAKPAAAAAVTTEPEPESKSLATESELKLNDDSLPLMEEIALAPPVDEPSTNQPGLSDFDLELDPPMSAAATLAPAGMETAEVPPLDIEIPELPPMAMTPAEQEIPEVSSAPEESNSSKLADPLDFDLSGISLDLDPQPEQADHSHQSRFAAAEESSRPMDLSGFDLPSEPMSLDLPADSLSLDDGLPDLDTHTTSADAEMSTKLDLAIAYQEIGDKEGARELLDEVLKGGSPEQSEKAKSLLHELA